MHTVRATREGAVECLACRRTFGPDERARGSISISVCGDEYIYSYWYCAACEQYTVESYCDRFLGEGSASSLGPFPRAVGDRCVELVRACPEPYSKNCQCPSHRALYYGLPQDEGS